MSLSVASWNPNTVGASGQHLYSIISEIREVVGTPLHIITIQEARLKDVEAARRLAHTYKGYIAIGLASPTGTDGVIILLTEAFISLGVSNISTVLRDSRAVSVRFTLHGDNYHILNLYLPNNDNARKNYIRTMVNPFQARDDFCLITMDANFVECRRRDRAFVQRPDATEAGAAEWNSYIDQGSASGWQDLAVLLATDDSPPVFTTIGVQGARVVEARIDRILGNELAAGRVETFSVHNAGRSKYRHHILSTTFTLGDAQEGTPTIQQVDRSLLITKQGAKVAKEALVHAAGLPREQRTGNAWGEVKAGLRAPLYRLRKKRDRQRRREQRDAERALHYAITFMRENVARIAELRSELDTITRCKQEERAVRFGNIWREKGEGRSTKQFYRSLKAARARSYIRSLKIPGTADTVSTTAEILEQFQQAWGGIFASPDVLGEEQSRESTTPDPAALAQVLAAILPIISEAAWPALNAIPTVAEIVAAILATQRGSTPGVDGLPAEYYKLAPEVAARILSDIYKDVWEGTFPPGFVHAVVSFLHKKGPRDEHGNYRPISLLNTDYKILAIVLVERLMPLLAGTLRPSQIAFIRKMFIGEHLVTMDILKELMGARQETAYIFMLDFKKAYDLLGWDFIEAIMAKLGFPPPFITVVMSLYRSSTYSFSINNTRGTPQRRGCGVIQGCPLAVLIFLLGMEAMAQFIESLPFHGIDVEDLRLLLLQFADDSASAHLSLQEGIELMQAIIAIFCPASHMALNLPKTFVLVINGTDEDLAVVRASAYQLANENPACKWLGIRPGFNSSEAAAWTDLVESTRKQLTYLCHRWLNPHARAMSANTLLLSRLYYPAQGALMPAEVVKKVDALTQEYCWRGFNQGAVTGTGRTHGVVRRPVCLQQCNRGGLNIKSMEGMAHAFACRWLDRWIERRPDAIWGRMLEALCHELYSNLGFEYLLLSNVSLRPHVDHGHLPPLWIEAITFARKHRRPVLEGKGHWVLSMPLFSPLHVQLPALKGQAIRTALLERGVTTYGGLDRGRLAHSGGITGTVWPGCPVLPDAHYHCQCPHLIGRHHHCTGCRGGGRARDRHCSATAAPLHLYLPPARLIAPGSR